jgi:hypothetical protein
MSEASTGSLLTTLNEKELVRTPDPKSDAVTVATSTSLLFGGHMMHGLGKPENTGAVASILKVSD